MTKEEYRVACKVRQSLRERFESLLEGGRIPVMPTVAGPAPMRAANVAELNAKRQADLSLLCIASRQASRRCPCQRSPSLAHPWA